MKPIYHILAAEEWNRALEEGFVAADSLSGEGFIHCSFAEQTEAVLDRFFPERSGLLILKIDPELLNADLRVEDTHGHGEKFPHVYGRIDTAAVLTVTPADSSGGS